MTLEKIIRDAGINTRGTIFNKSVQILAYADDINIIARTESTLKESFLALEMAAGNAKFIISEEKTKCMFCGKRDNPADFFEIDEHRFENVKKFTYLRSEIK